jgi:hypothetical protein
MIVLLLLLGGGIVLFLVFSYRDAAGVPGRSRGSTAAAFVHERRR